jgi:hypothetical protein
MSNDLKKQMLGSITLSRKPAAPRPKRDVPKEKYSAPEIVNGQAARVICRFGGARRLAIALKAIGEPMSPSAIYRWLKPKEAWGTGGRIPTAKLPAVMKAARLMGVLLIDEDLSPRVIDAEKMRDEYLADFNAFKMRAIRDSAKKQKTMLAHVDNYEHKQNLQERDSGPSELHRAPETQETSFISRDFAERLKEPAARRLERDDAATKAAMEALGFETPAGEEPPTGA